MKSKVVSLSTDVLGGTLVFAGTRVPMQAFIDYLKGGQSIADFLEGFPTVKREQVMELLSFFDVDDCF